MRVISGIARDRQVADLFAGSGALVIECLSRGAKKGYFVEKNLEAMDVIKGNVQNSPPSFEELENRIVARKTNTPDDIKRRLDKARSEMNEQDRYDYVVINSDLNVAAKQVYEIISRELEYSIATEKSNSRSHNEDAATFAANQDGIIFAALCDGMGGHCNGEIASQLSLEYLKEEFLKARRYEIVDTIGEGGMATILLAKDVIYGRHVALKRLKIEDIKTIETNLIRFKNEAQIISAVSSSSNNLVHIYDYFSEGLYEYIVMEFVDGENLKQVLRERSHFHYYEACQILYEIAKGLKAIHNCNIVHRDLKPENILIKSDGTIKIADFGISILEGANHSLTKANVIIGSVQYMAPEAITDKDSISKATDIYALGVILYEMITGCHLMVRDPIRDFPFYEKTGITTFMFHFESLYYREIKPFITDIKAKGIKPGIVINPKTNIEQIYEYLPKISSIMVMSVEPGYGGQPFQESTYARVEKIAKYREAKSLEFEIIVDGGINPTNAKELKKLGANTFVVGSYI
uniref:Protein kinase domain-containing protein n=1 Tax=Biomphalaria glabrata TaxID=6526 RepID=A0A2C9KCD5_BIOGL